MPLIPRNVAQHSVTGSGEVIDASQVTPGEQRQRLRMRRFAFASVFSMLFVFVLTVFHMQDKIDRVTLTQASVFVFAFILAFFFLFRTGLNLRFSDPSLTGWQFLAAVVTMLYLVYRAP